MLDNNDLLAIKGIIAESNHEFKKDLLTDMSDHFVKKTTFIVAIVVVGAITMGCMSAVGMAPQGLIKLLTRLL